MPKDSPATERTNEPTIQRTVQRAVIPAAGRGSRMVVVAEGRPKELLAIGGRSLLEHALADLAASGIDEALLIVSPHKPEIAATLGNECAGVRLRYAVQPEPRGLADALALAEPFVNGEPFVCWLPDNLWLGPPAASAQLIAALALAPGSHLVALIEHPASHAGSVQLGAAGFVDSSPLSSDGAVVRIDQVYGKGSRPPAVGATFLKGFPLDLWQPDLFDRIRRQRLEPRAGELDDTPILQQLAREGRLHGVVLRDGRHFDCGVPAGYFAAVAAAAAASI